MASTSFVDNLALNAKTIAVPPKIQISPTTSSSASFTLSLASASRIVSLLIAC